jgi:hypothetical protein
MEQPQNQSASPGGTTSFSFKDGFLFGLGFFTAGLIFTVVALLIFSVLFAARMGLGGGPRERAHMAAMKSDLRNLVSAEEAHFADFQTYSADLDSLYFYPSIGVTVIVWEATESGWRATATHPEMPEVTCEIYWGLDNESTAALTEGEVSCT